MIINGREEFIIEMAKHSYTEKFINKSKKVVADIINNFSLTFSDLILIVLTEPGINALEFMKKGFNITASGQIKQELRHRIADQVNDVEKINWLNYDLLSHNKKNKYNLILSIDFNFGYYKDSKICRSVISNFYQNLAHGGKLLIQLIGRDLLESFFTPKYWVEEENDTYLLNERQMDYQTGLLTENYTLIEKHQIKKFKYSCRLYYPLEIQNFLEKCGFKNIQFYGSWKKDHYNNKSNFLLAYAEKPLLSKNYIKC